MRRRAQRGMGGNLRRCAGMPTGICRRREAQRRLGQQRNGRQSAPRPEHQPRKAQGRQAGRRRPAAYQDRRAGRSASAIAARHRHIARLVRRRRARTAGQVGPSLHRRERARLRGVYGAGARLAGGPGRKGLRAAGEPDPDLRELARRCRTAGPDPRQRARTRPQWRQRHQGRDRFAGTARQARQRQWHRSRCEQCLPQDFWPNCTGRISCQRVRARSTSTMSGGI